MMQVKEVMTRNPETASPGVPIREVAEKMQSLNVGIIPICEGPRIVGVVTDRDVTIRATAHGRDTNTTPIREIMSSDLVCCYEDDDLEKCTRLMEERRIRRIPVLDRQEQLVGIVALVDLAVRGEAKETAGEVLTEVSEPTRPIR
jgi:CBS domain-containing protein